MRFRVHAKTAGSRWSRCRHSVVPSSRKGWLGVERSEPPRPPDFRGLADARPRPPRPKYSELATTDIRLPRVDNISRSKTGRLIVFADFGETQWQWSQVRRMGGCGQRTPTRSDGRWAPRPLDSPGARWRSTPAILQPFSARDRARSSQDPRPLRRPDALRSAGAEPLGATGNAEGQTGTGLRPPAQDAPFCPSSLCFRASAGRWTRGPTQAASPHTDTAEVDKPDGVD
jgi:hypothetical protein